MGTYGNNVLAATDVAAITPAPNQPIQIAKQMPKSAQQKLALENANPSNSNNQQNTYVTLNTDTDKVSYTIGYEMGKNFKSQNIVVNADIITKGLNDGLQGNQSMMSDKERQDVVASLQKQLKTNRDQVTDRNLKDGEAYLATNKTKTGVVTLPSGLQYRIIENGNGAQPKLTDVVTVNYQGSFIDGTVFDSSYKTGVPATFPLERVIKGWQEALQLMHVGSTWEIYVPSSLAYGDKGMGNIGPNEMLIFKIQLLSVSKG